MNDGDDLSTFEDTMRRGMKAVLRFSSAAGDQLRVASNRAVEKLDSITIEKKLLGYYRELGKLAYTSLSSGEILSSGNSDADSLVREITKLEEKLVSRKAKNNDETY